ncbi:MAG TPA: hypothetical protein DCQ87_07310 [Lachnospiraceae bacterium]|nr:hypothetical protein [Lachnospiraceae bacterium]
MNYVLIGSLILLVVAFAIGFYRGLFGLLSGLLTWIIILGFLYVATPLIEAKYMDGAVYKKFYNSVSEHISTSLITKENKKIDSLNAAASENTDTEDTTTDIGTPKKAAIDLSDSESLRDYLEKIGISIPKKASDFISKAVDSTTNAAAEIVSNITADNADKLSDANDTIVSTLSARTAALMVKGLAILTSLLIAFIITRALALIAQFIGDLPVVGGFSRFLGGVWGIIVALLIIWIFMDVVTCFSITPNGAKLVSQIQNNAFLDFLYVENPLAFLINK